MSSLKTDGSLSLDHHGVPALFLEIQGRWGGRYYKVAPNATKLKEFDGVFEISIEVNRYTQTNRYQFSDGTMLQLEFSGIFEKGILIMESTSRQNFSAKAWQAGPRLIIFECQKLEEASEVRYVESILIDSPTTRARTTLEFRDNEFAGVNFIRETRL